MNDERLERELRAAILEDDPGAAGVELRRRVAAVPDEVPLRRRFVVRSRPSRLLAAVAAIAALAVIGGTLIGVVGLRSIIVSSSPSASLSSSPRPSAPSFVPAPTANVDAAGLLDAQHGWAVASQRLLVTADGGSTWRDVTPPAGFGSDLGNPKGVAFLDAQHGWVAINEAFTSGSDPSYGRIDVWRTTDGGQTWAKAQLPQAVINVYGEILPDVQFDFLDASHGFAFLSGNLAKGANDSDLLWTADGGRTWSADRPTGNGNAGIEGTVGFATANDGVIVNALHGNGIVVTHDGGRTWMDATFALPPGSGGAQLFFGQPVFFDGRSGLVSIDFQTDSGSVTRVYRTSDAGSSWTTAATLPAGYLAISLLDQRRWVAFNGSEVLRTEDAGATWTETPSVSPSSYSSGPQFVDDATGWWLALEGVAGGSVLLATTDGGVTWHALAPVTAAPEASATASPSPTPTMPAQTPSPAEVSAAKDVVDRYTAALVRGDYPASWAMLAPEAHTPWGSLANYSYERSAYFKSVGGRYTIQVWPTDVAPITFWLTATYGASIDLRHAVLVKVDYPALAGNNAGFDLYIVSPGAKGLAIFSVR